MIDKKWKWVAKDENDQVYVFKERPVLIKEQLVFVWRTKETTEWHPCTALIPLPESYRDSLHEIIHHEDGKIEFRKVRPELKVDDPVLVKLRRSTQWSRRHFACWDEKNGLIRCWDEGRTSFTSEGINSVWDDYKLP